MAVITSIIIDILTTNYLFYRELNSETPRKLSEDGYPSRHMTTRSWIRGRRRTGLQLRKIGPKWSRSRTILARTRLIRTTSRSSRTMLLTHKVIRDSSRLRYRPRDFGRIVMVSASGESSRFKSTSRNPSVTKATGRTLVKRSDFTGSTSSLMTKIRESLPRDSLWPTTPESLPIPFSSTTSTLKTCQLIRFPSHRTIRSIESLD